MLLDPTAWQQQRCTNNTPLMPPRLQVHMHTRMQLLQRCCLMWWGPQRWALLLHRQLSLLPVTATAMGCTPTAPIHLLVSTALMQQLWLLLPCSTLLCSIMVALCQPAWVRSVPRTSRVLG